MATDSSDSPASNPMPDLPEDDFEKVDVLITEMTLEEKLAQLGSFWSTQLVSEQDGAEGFSVEAAGEHLGNGAGQITRIAASTGLHPAEIAEFTNEIQQWLTTNTRLGIPAVIHEEAVAGFCARDAVQFPQAIGLGSTFDADLVGSVAGHIRTEMLAVGARHSLSPVLDVSRDPRWGRLEETYGEDPVLAGTLGAAYVAALQNNDGGGLIGGVVATGKHFLGYAASDGGLNHGPAQIGSRELREVHAEPFAAAIREAGLQSVMNSYASIDGLPPAGSRALLTELLRDELGFEGTVVADYFAVDLLRTFHRVAPTRGVAGAKAILAGLDQELPGLNCFSMRNLGPLVEAGVVPMDVIDQSVRRVLTQKAALGLFQDPFVDVDTARATFGTPLGVNLARRAAEESLILLSNDDGLIPITLPLGADNSSAGSASTVAVIGPAADDVRLMEGDYHYPAHLEIIYGDDTDGVDLLPEAGGAFAPGPYFPPIVTPFAGITHLLGDSVTVTHSPGCGVLAGPSDSETIAAAVKVASATDLAVVCLGGRSGLTPTATVGEARDASDLDLTGAQMELLRAVSATGTPVVAVICSGRAHTLAEVEELADATLLAWVPGQEGGTAIANVLFGEVAPSGRLPVSLPRSVGQLPVHYAHRAGGGASQFWGDYTDSPTTALHEFGFGLTTTEFQYSRPMAEVGSTTEPTRLTVEITNTGDRSATEVVQLYAADEFASVARPDRELVGFTRVPLKPAETATVTFEVHPSRLAFFDEDFRFVCEPGAFDLEVGGSAGHPRQKITIDLDGEVNQFRQRDVVATKVELS